MIFKTINTDAKKLTEQFGLLNKSFQDIKKDFANGLGFKNSLFQTSISKTDYQSLQKFNSAIKDTNDGLTKSQRITKAWNENMTGCSIAAKRMGNDLITGKKKISDVSNSMKTATASTKALGVAMNVFTNIGFMLAITAITKVVSELAQAQENATQAAKEATETYKSELDSIADYKQRLSELHEELKSGNLSYEETKTKRTELMTIQDELIQKFGTEKGAIESVTEAINGQIDALDNLNEKAYRDWVAKADEQTFWNKLLPGGKSGLDQAIDYMETEKTVSFMDMQNANLSDELQEIQKEIDKTIQSKYNLEKSFATFNVTGTPDEIRTQLENIRQDYADISKRIFERKKLPSGMWDEYRKEVFDSIDEVLLKLDDGLKKHQETYQTYIEGMIKYDSEYSDEYANILQKRAELESAQNSGSKEEIQKAKREFMDSINNAIIASDTDENIKKYFESLYPGLQAEFASWSFEFDLDVNKDNISDIANEIGEKYSATDLLDMVNTEGEESFNKLIDKAIEYGVCTDKSAEEVQKLIDLLVKLEYVQGDIQGSNPTNEIDLLSISSTIDQLNTKLKPAMDSLESAWNNIFTDDGFTLENIDLSTFEAIKSKLDEMSKLGLEVDTSSFENFVTVLNDTDSTAEQVKDAFDDLATSIVDAGVSGIEDFQLLKDTLQEMGVQNFEIVALEELIKNTEALKAAGLDLVNATDVQIQAFAEEMVSAENAAQAYNLLLYAKELNNLAKMSTAGEVAELQNLAENAGITGNVIIWLTELEQIYQEIASGLLDPSNPMAINGKLIRAAMLKGLIDSAATEIKFSGNEVDYKPLAKAATKAAGKAGKDAGKSYKDKLKDELSSIGDVLNYINDIIGDQIDLLGDQKDAAVDALNAEKEAAEAALQAQIDLVEAQIDAIEKQIEAKKKEIDKIKEAREERQREIDLQKKQYDFLRMQNQKIGLIYKGEPGQFVYETDTQGIRDARESLEEAKENIYIAGIEKEISLLEDEISNLEDVIDSLNNQIEASNKYYEDLIKSTENYYDGLIKNLEDYQNRWKEIGEIEEQAKIQVKLKELGITTEDILNMSEDAFNSFKQQYLAILTEMYSGEQDMIQAINDVANGIDVTTLTGGLNQTKENIDNLNEADFNSVSTGLNDISDGMGNVGTSASSASDKTSAVSTDLQELSTNADGLDTKISNISSALTNMPDGTNLDGLATSFTNLGEAIKSVADALGISGEDSVSGLVTALTELGSFSLSGEKGEGGIIEQFQNLKTAVDEVTSAINGGGSTGESASATNASGVRTGSSMGTGNSTVGGGSGLTGAIKEIGTTTDETIGSGGEGEGTGGKDSGGEGVLGKFGQFKSAVEEVTKAIGTGEEESGEEGATSLISALQLHYEKAEETLPEVNNMFEELLAKILECVSALGELAGAMSSLGGEGFAFGTVGTGFSGGTDPKASFTTTVGKAFAKGTDRFKGLDKDTLALRSEYNQSELTMYPDGKIELTNSPNLKVLPKNTKIFNEKQTQEMLNNKGTVIGNAYADGNAVIEKSSRFDNMRDLQPGDRMYDMFQKWNAYFEKNDHSFIEPVNAIQKNTEEIARSVSNVNTNNIQRSVNIGDINITCPGVTSNEVAKQITTELHKQIGGIALEALQESHITR